MFNSLAPVTTYQIISNHGHWLKSIQVRAWYLVVPSHLLLHYWQWWWGPVVLTRGKFPYKDTVSSVIKIILSHDPVIIMTKIPITGGGGGGGGASLYKKGHPRCWDTGNSVYHSLKWFPKLLVQISSCILLDVCVKYNQIPYTVESLI